MGYLLADVCAELSLDLAPESEPEEPLAEPPALLSWLEAAEFASVPLDDPVPVDEPVLPDVPVSLLPVVMPEPVSPLPASVSDPFEISVSPPLVASGLCEYWRAADSNDRFPAMISWRIFSASSLVGTTI